MVFFMRRADRLLQIIQVLRRADGPITSAAMAEELEVSQRTLYRDMVSLEASGVPVRGEAGIGYILEDGYDMPPLMFTAAELEALMLGARMVDGRVDSQLSRAARDAITKIANVIPSDLREVLIDTPLYAPLFVQEDTSADALVQTIRAALRQQAKVSIRYRALNGTVSERTIWPVLISLFSESSVLVGWCELRDAFRTFRLDGLQRCELLDQKIPERRRALYKKWRSTDSAAVRNSTVASAHGVKIHGV